MTSAMPVGQSDSGQSDSPTVLPSDSAALRASSVRPATGFRRVAAAVRNLWRRPAKVGPVNVEALVETQRSAGLPARPTVPREARPPSTAISARALDLAAHYESGQMGGYDRSWLPHFVQDARYDIGPGERLEMVRKSRYFECNNGDWQKILDLIETNVVGTGIHATPASSSPAWNEAAQNFWEEWCQFADLKSRQSFYTLQALMARAQAVDGEIFVWLTHGETGFPRIQLIETHRVCDARLPRQYEQEGYTQYDGILTDARGRPMFYVVSNDADAFAKNTPRSVALLPAEQIVHIFEPGRDSQPRGIPLPHAVLHVLHDLDDLERYEMLASKDAASRANIVKTKTGEMPPDTNGGAIIGQTVQVPAGNGTMEERIVYYKTAFGGRTVVMMHDDEWDQSEALRPTSAQREFWERLERRFCRGVGISYAAFRDYEGNWGGAALRGAITSDNRFYDVRTNSLTPGLQRIYEHVQGWGIRSGRIGVQPPANWRAVTWHSPRRATVDIGRESKSILEELAAGIRTERDILGEVGLDYDAVRGQRVIEVTRRLEAAKIIAEKFELPVLTAYALLAKPPAGLTVSAPVEEAEDPAPQPNGPPDPAPVPDAPARPRKRQPSAAGQR